MGSKSLLLPGFLLACALLIASEVGAARELAEAASTSKENSKETNGVEEAPYGGGYGGYTGDGYGGGYTDPPGYHKPPGYTGPPGYHKPPGYTGPPGYHGPPGYRGYPVGSYGGNPSRAKPHN